MGTFGACASDGCVWFCSVAGCSENWAPGPTNPKAVYEPIPSPIANKKITAMGLVYCGTLIAVDAMTTHGIIMISKTPTTLGTEVTVVCWPKAAPQIEQAIQKSTRAL